MQFDYPHTLDPQEACERLEVLGTYLRNRHGIQVHWNGREGTFKGKYLMVTIDGQMTVEDKQLRFNGKDPGRLWRGKAVKYLKEKLEIYLNPLTPVSELPTNK